MESKRMAKPDFPALPAPGMHPLTIQDLHVLAVAPLPQDQCRSDQYEKLCIWAKALKAAGVTPAPHAASYSKKRLWMALALSKSSLCNAFHWQPVRCRSTRRSPGLTAGWRRHPIAMAMAMATQLA